MLEFLVDIDTEIFLWLNSHHSPFWDIFMYVSSGKALWIPLYLSIVFAIYAVYGWRATLIMVAVCGISVAVVDQVGAGLLRPLIERMRPANLENPLSEFVHIVEDYRGGAYGFPSSHASNTFALAAFTSFAFRKWTYGIFIYIWAVVICYSRIYLGVHYPGDILAGFILGSVFGWIGYIFAKSLIEAFKIKVTPQKNLFMTPALNPVVYPVYTGILTFICIVIFTLIT